MQAAGAAAGLALSLLPVVYPAPGQLQLWGLQRLAAPAWAARPGPHFQAKPVRTAVVLLVEARRPTPVFLAGAAVHELLVPTAELHHHLVGLPEARLPGAPAPVAEAVLVRPPGLVAAKAVQQLVRQGQCQPRGCLAAAPSESYVEAPNARPSLPRVSSWAWVSGACPLQHLHWAGHSPAPLPDAGARALAAAGSPVLAIAVAYPPSAQGQLNSSLAHGLPWADLGATGVVPEQPLAP